MTNRYLVSFLLIFLLSVSSLFAAIHEENVSYQAGDTQLIGFLAYDDSIQDKRPGVLVVHEWWGLNDYARKRARMLAELGYAALAVDMYGGGRSTEHPTEAGAFSKEAKSNLEVAQKRFAAGLETLKNHPRVDPEKMAAIGYCFGGGIVLEMARRGLDLDGVASFHGSLATDVPAKPGQVKAKVRVFTGSLDHMVPEPVIQTFKDEMTAAGADYDVIVYEGAKHGFTNPDADLLASRLQMPIAYDPAADQDSWQKMISFFDQLFKE